MSKEKYAVELNTGAAYAQIDPIAGASLIYSHPDLQNIPEIHLILNGATLFQQQIMKERQYETELKQYNALSGEEKKNIEEPTKPEKPQHLDIMQGNYATLLQAMQTRLETFETNYNELTTKEMQEIFVNKTADDYIPKTAKEELDKNSETKIKDLEGNTKNYTDIIKLHYIKDYIPYEISRRQMQGQLEQIAKDT